MLNIIFNEPAKEKLESPDELNQYIFDTVIFTINNQ